MTEIEKSQPKTSSGFAKSQPKPVRCGCGGEAKVISYLSRDYCMMVYYVRCENCGTETDDLYSEAEAIQAWNTAMGTNTRRLLEVLVHDATDTNVGDKDLISRQEALDAVHYYIESGYKCDIFQELKNLPSAEPERKKGKWVKVSGYFTPGGDPVWKCSECGKGMHVYGIEAPSYNKDYADGQWVACPNCGADMRGDR